MPPDTHIEMLNAEAERLPEPPKEAGPNLEALGAAAADLGRRLVWLPGTHSARFFSERYRALRRAIRPVLRAFQGSVPTTVVGDDFRWLNDNLRLVHADLRGTKDGFKLVRKLPHVRTPDGAIAPRVVALAAGYLATTSYEFSVNSLNAYVQAFQQSTVLRMVELWALVPALKLVLLEEIAARGSKVAADPAGSYGAGICVRSLRDIGQTSWKEVLEPLVLFDRILRQDPAGAYAAHGFREPRSVPHRGRQYCRVRRITRGRCGHRSARPGALCAPGNPRQPAPDRPPWAHWLLPSRRKALPHFTAEWAFSLRWASASGLCCAGIRMSFICRQPKC